MEEQTTPKPTEQALSSKTIWTAIISVVITAVIVGSGFYVWHQSSLKTTEQTLQDQIVQLQNQVSELQKENTDLKTADEPSSATSSKTSANIQFPVVVYGRPGLLHNTKEGLAEKKNLEEKFVHPYTDYHNEEGIELVALYITVPQNIGQAYDVVGIFGSENQYGTEQFSFGAREQEYDYWKPDCMGGLCPFSDAFKKKYPQIAE